MSDAIHLENVTITLPNQQVLLENVQLQVAQGETVALVGLSGCGKSILAKTIAGIIPQYLTQIHATGTIELLGKVVSNMELLERLHTVGYIFQNPDNQIFSSIVEMELAFGLENLCVSVEQMEQRITEVLKEIGMEKLRYENTHNLSGGQKQLLTIGSILALQPRILICDEILCQLDYQSCTRVLEILQKLKNMGITIFMIEHDLEKLTDVDKIYTIQGKQLIEYKGEISE